MEPVLLTNIYMKRITIIGFTKIILTAGIIAGSCKNATTQDKDINFSQDLLLNGCWFIPHNADVNIRFKKDFTFEFTDFDNKTMKEVLLSGTYSLEGHDLLLKYKDRPEQKFYFYKGESTDDNYYIKGYPLKTTSYYFVHGECNSELIK